MLGGNLGGGNCPGQSVRTVDGIASCADRSFGRIRATSFVWRATTWSRQFDRLDLTLYWQALDRPPADYVVFVHLFDPLTEQIPVQSDSMPRGNQYPTSRWAAGEVVVDTITLSLADLPAGAYRLGVGLYQIEGDRYLRLPAVVDSGEALPDGRYVLPAEILIAAEQAATRIGVVLSYAALKSAKSQPGPQESPRDNDEAPYPGVKRQCCAVPKMPAEIDNVGGGIDV